MSDLGTVTLYIKKGTICGGIALLDDMMRPVGGSPLRPIRPGDGDKLIVEIKEVPEGEGA